MQNQINYDGYDSSLRRGLSDGGVEASLLPSLARFGNCCPSISWVPLRSTHGYDPAPLRGLYDGETPLLLPQDSDGETPELLPQDSGGETLSVRAGLSSGCCLSSNKKPPMPEGH